MRTRPSASAIAAVLGALIAFGAASGCVDSKCLDTADCPGNEICDSMGQCILECVEDEDCATGFVCEDNACRPPEGPAIDCPEDMVAVANAFCVDRYEASRPDATASAPGTDESRAVSVQGVIPWQVSSNAAAQAACEAAGKRLCTPEEWRVACRGPGDTAYSYGDDYDAAACNGIDAFCRCDSTACSDLEECPYPRCYNRPSPTEDGGPCGADFTLVPTGSFPDCTNDWGLYDINGNLWEHTADGSDMTVRGGAFNCADSVALHRCDYVPGDWRPSARGFRCCLSEEADD